MLSYVYAAATSCQLLSSVLIATDSNEILDLCAENGWSAMMTSPAHPSGTDRVHEVARKVKADVYLNLQGDEPLLRREHIEALLNLMKDPSVAVGTLKTPCTAGDMNNPNAVKVVTDNLNRALYFSRATIPFARDEGSQPRYFKHLGFYAYRPGALEVFCSLPVGGLERVERLEQLRFLENGVTIKVAETPFDTIGVDTESDLHRAEKILLQRDTDDSQRLSRGREV